MNLDHNVTIFANDLVTQSRITSYVVIFFGEYFIYFVLITVFFVGYMLYHKQKKITVLFPFISAGLSAALAYFPVAFVIKNVTARLRPFMVLSLHQLIQDNSFAFPSGHTIFLFALGAMIFPYHKKIGVCTFVSGCAVGTARIAAGVHYPSDVVGGVLIGTLVGIVVYFFHKHYLIGVYTRITMKHL